MLARWKDGLPLEEHNPLGFRLIRIKASAQDGIPFMVLPGSPASSSAGSTRGGPAPPPAARGPARGRFRHCRRPSPGRPRRSAPARLICRRSPRGGSRFTGGRGGLQRRTAIPLTIRSHQRNAVRQAPPGDLYHGMAFMGILVALDLASAIGSSSSTTHVTSTRTPATSPGWDGPRAGSWAASSAVGPSGRRASSRSTRRPPT